MAAGSGTRRRRFSLSPNLQYRNKWPFGRSIPIATGHSFLHSFIHSLITSATRTHGSAGSIWYGANSGSSAPHAPYAARNATPRSAKINHRTHLVVNGDAHPGVDLDAALCAHMHAVLGAAAPAPGSGRTEGSRTVGTDGRMDRWGEHGAERSTYGLHGRIPRRLPRRFR